MNKSDIEFTVGLNTSPAEQQLDKLYSKMRNAPKTSPLLQQVANEYSQGFKMVGTPYDSGSNRFGVPSTQVLNTALVATTQTLKRFETTLNSVIYMSSRILDDYLKKASQLQIGYTPSNFTEYRSNAYARLGMTGNPYSKDFTTVGGVYNGYNNYGVPSTVVNTGGLVPVSKAFSSWSPTEFYTHAQVDDINKGISGGYNPNDIFNSLIYKRKASQSYSSAYDIFSNIHSSQGASGMYEIWSGLFGQKEPLALPAPKNVWGGADGNDTPEEQGKDVVEQDKKDNNELKEKLLLWGKIGATIYAIRKVISGLAKLWKFGAETVSGVNSNLDEEHGFFSIDPEGALRANSDKTRAVLYAGIRNMGENAPVSKAGLDYASSKMTEMWTAAMSGRNVDARTTIDVQRLKDFFGIDLTVAGLLTGERDGKTATDIQIDMMEKVEKQISKLAEADEVTKGQVIDSLKNILGDELVNAIVANANKNLKIDASDLKLTLAERLIQSGGSAIPAGNLTDVTTGAVKAISKFEDAIQGLKNTIVKEFGPAFTTITNVLTNGIEWINEKLNKVEGEKNALGEAKNRVSLASLTSSEYSRYRNFKQTEDDRKDKYKNKETLILEALRSKDPLKILDALYLAQPETKSAADIENLMIKQQEMNVGQALKEGYFDPNSSNPIIKALAKKTVYDNKGNKLTGYDAFLWELENKEGLSWDLEEIKRLFRNQGDMSEHEKLLAIRNFVKLNPDVKKAFAEAFDVNGKFDFNTGKGIFEYLYNIKNFSSYEDQYQALKALSGETFKVLDNTVNMSTTWNDVNRNGIVDLGEVEVTLVVKDIDGKVITKQNIQGDLQ